MQKKTGCFIGFCGVSFLIRLLLAFYHGFDNDLQGYITWGQLLDRQFLQVYTLGAHIQPVISYPPLGLYIWGCWTGLYVGGAALFGFHPTTLLNQSLLLSAWMKLPTIAADMGAIVLLYPLARHHFSERRALLITASYAFNPAILFDGALWGQTESIISLLVLLALLCALDRRGMLAGVLLALAFLFKPQPAIFALLLLGHLWRWAGWKQALRALGGMLLTSLVVCAPYLLPPKPEMLAFLEDLTTWAALSPAASSGVFNLWWPLGDWAHNRPLVGPFSPDLIGWTLFVLILVGVLVKVWQDEHLFLWAALLALAVFVVAPLQHERYLYPAIPLFLVASFTRKAAWGWYILVSVTAFLNMTIYNLSILSLVDDLLPASGLAHYPPAAPMISLLCWAAALMAMLLNLWLLGRVLWETRAFRCAAVFREGKEIAMGGRALH